MIILITQGGWGVQNWAKLDYVICARSLAVTTKFVVTAVTTKLVVSAYFLESCVLT